MRIIASEPGGLREQGGGGKGGGEKRGTRGFRQRS